MYTRLIYYAHESFVRTESESLMRKDQIGSQFESKLNFLRQIILLTLKINYTPFISKN